MKIVVCSQDGRTVSGHAGRARKWVWFEGERGMGANKPMPSGQLELPPTQVIHTFKADGPHPLDEFPVLITRFAGQGFVNRMRKRGVEVRFTRERSAAKAARDFLKGTLAPPPNRRVMDLVCKVRDLFSEHA
ncbi:MAG: hypothetical protein IPK66_18440 [Rhodospirillales bacterium]|nr:hypothetical protein [Rhodospirillales bacterium]